MVWKSLPCLFQCQHHMVCVCDVRCSVGSVCSGKTWKKSQTTDYPHITHRLQFSEMCYGVSREHLQLWCHVSHCISFESVFERVLFVPEKHPSRCLECPWSRPWRLRPQTPSMRNVLTTTEKGFRFPGICFHVCYLTPSHILQPRPDWLLVVVGCVVCNHFQPLR